MLTKLRVSDIDVLHSKANKEQQQLGALLSWLNSLTVPGDSKLVNIAANTIQIPKKHRILAARLLQVQATKVKDQQQTSSISKLQGNFSAEQIEDALEKALLEVQQYNGETKSTNPQKGYKTLQCFLKQLGLNLESTYAEISRNRCTNNRYAVIDSLLPKGTSAYFPILKNPKVDNLLDIAMKPDSGTDLKDALLAQTVKNYLKYSFEEKKKTKNEIKELLANVDLVEVFLNGLHDFKEEIIYHRLKDLHNKLIGKMTPYEKDAIVSNPNKYTQIFGPVLERNKELIQESAKKFAYLLAL